MLLQSLLLIATLAIIGSTLLTSTLVSAKARFHAEIMQMGRSAMTDATADFIAWTQNNIRDNGIDQLSVWAAKPQALSPRPACGGTMSVTIGGTSSSCNVFQAIKWNVTGFTNASDEFKTTTFGSEATNMATAQDERRISVTINTDITDSKGSIVFSRQSREITARIFHAYPYVAVTGERDATSEMGSIQSAEGDTAGFEYENKAFEDGGSVSAEPTSEKPASRTETTLLTTIDCTNSSNNLPQNATPLLANTMFTNIRAFGNLAWINEVPCISTVPIDPSTAPAGYKPALGNVYGSQATYDTSWNKNDDNKSSFAR